MATLLCFPPRQCVCHPGGGGVHGAGALSELHPGHTGVCLRQVPAQESPHPVRRHRNSSRLCGPPSQSACKHRGSEQIYLFIFCFFKLKIHFKLWMCCCAELLNSHLKWLNKDYWCIQAIAFECFFHCTKLQLTRGFCLVLNPSSTTWLSFFNMCFSYGGWL